MNEETTLVISIADELYRRGVKRCESISINEWRRRGWPEAEWVYKLIDSYIKLSYLIEERSGKDTFVIKIEKSD